MLIPAGDNQDTVQIAQQNSYNMHSLKLNVKR